jgi:hypothetical protein
MPKENLNGLQNLPFDSLTLIELVVKSRDNLFHKEIIHIVGIVY